MIEYPVGGFPNVLDMVGIGAYAWNAKEANQLVYMLLVISINDCQNILRDHRLSP
jgi:hypothetical protein